jgi:16S rRNA (adenine1518-N6/adenine1519-N6)-dimethyltransferase
MNHRAKKSLGQNFLVDQNYQQKIIDALELQPEDRLLEIGPGTGALTHHLVGNVKHLTAIELDDALFASLQRQYGQRADVSLIHQDVLTEDLSAFASHKVVGNIPYNITSPLIFKLLERENRPISMVLMVQKEVADRIVAPAGEKDYGALTIGIQSVAGTERLFNVPRGAFRPVPNVDSAVVRIVPRNPPNLTPRQEDDLRELTRSAFSWRRKQLQNILRNADGYGLDAEQLAAVENILNTPMTKRPEQLTPDAFVQLSKLLRERGFPSTSS